MKNLLSADNVLSLLKLGLPDEGTPPERYISRDGIYEKGDQPPNGSGIKYIVKMGHKPGDQVWVMVKEFQDLGTMNGWPKDSKNHAIVKTCEEAGHVPSGNNEGRCLNRYTCEECGYFYKIDSGD